MPLVLDTVAAVAATGTVANAVVSYTPATGDSFTVRSFAPTGKANLDFVSAQMATANPSRIRSPQLHDDVQGLRFSFLATDPEDQLNPWGDQQLVSQDTLLVELVVTTAPGASQNDVLCYGVYYSDLTGGNATLRMPSDIQPNIVNLETIPVTVPQSATVGNWGSALITANQDLMKANTYYAILGYEVDTAVAGVGIQGADTSNFRVGGPGTTDRYKTRTYFVDKSNSRGTPHIPVINSANKNATNVQVACNATGGNVLVTLLMAQLSGLS